MTTRRVRAASLLAVAVLGLSACGGSDEGSAKETSSSQSRTDESGESAEAEASDAEGAEGAETTEAESDGDDAGAAVELADPGSELEVGETATVPQGEEGAAITLTVSGITKGSSADLEKLEDAEKYADYTPVYVEYTMTGTASSSALRGDVLDDVDPITADGAKAGTLVIIGTSPFEKCDANSIPDDFGPGDTETTCQVAMLAAGQEIGGAQYAPFDGDYADDGKVVWTQ